MSEAEFNEVINVAKVMSDYDKPWAVCGGWAIDLFLGRVTRAHKDVDLVVLRREQLIIQGYLLSRGWTLEKAVSGQLVPWQPGEWIDLPVHVIWCRNSGTSPDFIELVFNEVSDTNFLFRRNLSITLPVERMIILSAIGIPILAPEIVLLYKSPKPEDSVAASDFKNVLPGLSFERRDWLEASLKKLHPGHTWLKYL
jgi:hypothetical protein